MSRNTHGVAIVVIILLALLGGCATTGGGKDITVRFEEYPRSSIPAFVAKVRIESSIGNVMSILMDFSSWPGWAYGCERIEVLETIGYTDAYLYQVTKVPVIRNRDSIIHAMSSSSDGEVVIRFEAAPDYCLDSQRSACEMVNESRLIRVTEMSGSFALRNVSANEVEVTWQQHLDPAGWVPDFLVRWKQGDIPVRSLTRLKALAESH